MAEIAVRIMGPKECSIHSLALSPDGKLVAAGADIVRVYDTTTGDLVQGFEQETVMVLAFSPDGTLLAAGDMYDACVCLWHVETGTKRATFQGLEVGSLAFSPDGCLLACGTNMITLFDVESGKKAIELTGNSDWAISLAFDSTGSLLASGVYLSDVTVWDLSLKKLLFSLERKDTHYVESGRAVAFSLDDSQIISIHHATVRFWDAASGNEIVSRRIELSERASGDGLAAINHDRTRFALKLYDSIPGKMDEYSIGIFDVATGGQAAELQAGKDFEPRAIAFDPTGALFASADGAKDERDRITLWRL